MIIALIQEYWLIWKLHLDSVGQNVPANWAEGIGGHVILLQGFNGSWYTLKQFGDQLNRLGYRIHVLPRLRHNRMRVLQSVTILADFIQLKRLKKVTIIAHSKGGLIAKLYLDSLAGQHHISKIISIASPYHGTLWGYLSHSYLYELRPGSPQIQEVLKDQAHLDRIFNLYAAVDNNVVPNKSAFLEGAHNYKINITGHTRILFAPQTWQVIKKVLAISS